MPGPHVLQIDPSAFTPPYDRALSAALSRAGAEVELITSPFSYGPVPEPDGYGVSEMFYRRAHRLDPASRARVAVKAAEHLPGMIQLRRRLLEADLAHYQWLTFPPLDRLIRPDRSRRHTPQVITLHYPLPDPGDRRANRRERRILSGFDAVVSHSEHGARRLREQIGLDPARIEVIPHGAFDYLTRRRHQAPLPAELEGATEPVILFFGLLRPYKGIEVLLEAFRGIAGAELWIAGMPRMETAPLERAAARARGRVRLLPRFVTDDEIPALMRAAELVVLPYRRIEQSGVLYTALAFGKPIVLSAVGGFTEIAERDGAALAVPPGDPVALREALAGLLADPAEREALAARARAAAAGRYSWDSIAVRTLELYERLLAAHDR